MSEKEIQWLDLHEQWACADQHQDINARDAVLEALWLLFLPKAQSIISRFVSQCKPYLERDDYLQEGYVTFHTIMYYYGPSALTAKLYVMLNVFDRAFRRHCAALIKKARGKGYTDTSEVTFKEVVSLTEEYEALLQYSTPTEQERNRIQILRNEIASFAPEIVTRFDVRGDALELVPDVRDKALQLLWKREAGERGRDVSLESVTEVADTTASLEGFSSPLAVTILEIAKKIAGEEKDVKKHGTLNLILNNWQRPNPILDKHIANLMMVTPARVSQIKKEFVEQIKLLLSKEEF